MSARAELTYTGDVVLKRHPAGTDAALLAAQLEVASREPYREVLLSPLSTVPATAPDGRLVTLWPRVDVLDPGDSSFPWIEAGALLARLHRMPVPPLHAHGGRARVARAAARAADLPPGGATDVLRSLALELLRAWPEPHPHDRLLHGDCDLGQLCRRPGTSQLLLLDLDDLGTGPCAWDLGRPAGFFAAGLLDDADWYALLTGYRNAGGYMPEPGRPWPDLDHPARCAVLVAAVREQVTDYSSDTAATLLAACVRMAGLTP